MDLRLLVTSSRTLVNYRPLMHVCYHVWDFCVIPRWNLTPFLFFNTMFLAPSDAVMIIYNKPKHAAI